MSPLTVLHVNTERGFRGGEIQNLYLAAGLQERGHRSIVAAQSGSPLAERARERGLEVREAPMQGEFDLTAAGWLRGILRREAPHVVHYHTSHAVTLGTLARWSRAMPRTVATRRTSFPTRRNPLFRLKFTFRLDRVIAVSASIVDDLVEAGIPRPRLAVVHSGIDLSRYEDRADPSEFRAELGITADAPLIGCVGALAPQKGHEVLLQALASLGEERPAPHCVLVGQGELRDRILDEARAAGLGDRVHLTGFRDDIPRVTAACDLAVLPSISGEGSPAAVKEAMACGIPIIATDIGGVREILENGRQGLVVPAGDADAIANALRRLLRDPAERDAMGEAGRQRVREFSMERMIERTERIYAELVGETPAAVVSAATLGQAAIDPPEAAPS